MKTQVKSGVKTSMNIPDDHKVVLIIDKVLADSLGRLLHWAIKHSQKGEKEANEMPPISRLSDLNNELQRGSFVLEDGVWLQDAILSLERGQSESE